VELKMEAICERGNGVCQARALATLLHSLNFYCASISAALVCCHAKSRAWRHQDLRGVASIVVGMAWCCGATAAAFLRSADTVYLVMSLMSTLAWVAAAVLHVVLWNRRSASPTLYLAVYWLLTAVSSSAVLFEHVKQGGTFTTIEVYIQSVTVMCAVVTKRSEDLKSSQTTSNVSYKHYESHFYSRITFFWLNSFLYNIYDNHIEDLSLGTLPEEEKTKISYQRLRNISNYHEFIDEPVKYNNNNEEVSLKEFLNNGYTMLVVTVLALIVQALLSQYSTHLNLLFDKCMRLASWSAGHAEKAVGEHSPLLSTPHREADTQTGMLTNLVTQDTYNIMSCVWICHYTWAIPLKVLVILYVLYTKLGVSAIIGVATSIFIITPLQFFIGKKISDNSKNISKCTDHRASIMSEILNGINVIKLYVWEDLFNEKILQFREVELQHLNKDSFYWSFLTLSAQFSTVLVSVVTFMLHYYLNSPTNLTAVNIFTGLALFNQLSIPLLILPVTVLMVIQAMVSTKRINEFLDLPESNNIKENKDIYTNTTEYAADFAHDPCENPLCETDEHNDECDELMDRFNNEQLRDQDHLIVINNASFSWRARKLIMVVGSSCSGKSSLLSAILGEMQLEQGQVNLNTDCSMWYAGLPPWLLDWSIRDNILMGSPWCATRYARVIRATGLRADLQLLPDGDRTVLGNHGTPLSGGQRLRVCVARALYSRARLVVLDEPLAALDGPLAKHVVTRGLVPAARSGRTILLATNRLELLHYADLVIVMDNGRISGVCTPTTMKEGPLCDWWQLASEARANVAKSGAGPPGGTAEERSTLARTLSRVQYQRSVSEDNIIDINEATGAHLLAELSTCAGSGMTWRRAPRKVRTSLLRYEVRRTVSADATTDGSKEAGFLGRLLHSRGTLTRWTPKTLRRFMSSDSETNIEGANEAAYKVNDSTLSALSSNGLESSTLLEAPQADREPSEPLLNENKIWWEYVRSGGWWGAVYLLAAATAQAMIVAADCWLSQLAQNNKQNPFNIEQRLEATSAARVVSLTTQCSVGAGTVRAANLQNKLREIFQARVDDNHNTLLLLNSANRWLGLGLDLVGMSCVLTTLCVALHSDSAASVAGLAGSYSLLLPVYLAHLAKCRADLRLQLGSLERILTDINAPQEDYRDECSIPSGWQRSGKIEFQQVDVQHQPDSPIILKSVNLTVNPGQKHRISSVTDYDSGVTLDGGRVVERGNIDTLLSDPS
ncbi:unnamed protein product, partial [Leptidea sinapis]